jgi:hypothetical protein
MKTDIKKIRLEGRKVWQWTNKEGRRIVSRGYCRTKRDAVNDALIVSGQNRRKSGDGERQA